MSEIDKLTQKAYQDLCTELGHLEFKIKKTEAALHTLKDQKKSLIERIEHINESKPILKIFETKEEPNA